MKIIAFFLLALVPTLSQAACVILLHGLARSASSMETLEQALTEQEYKVVNLGYPSRDHSIEELAQLAIAPALEQCGAQRDIHFVTHSLGGILVRQYLSTHHLANLKYVVMLGPPNQGSEVVDKLGVMPGFHFINGDAGLQLGTGELSLPNSLGPANFNVGIIAGSASINWLLSTLIPGTDDGKVSVERTKLEGMQDHLELDVTHPFMMKNKQVIAEVIFYLEKGRFNASTADKE